ncbi:hypothetical protein EDD90_2818 [Streptomyces sp. Ag109_O5-1]|nr:hypothetical protein EDD90_2818 [Streptomyces sp. Ag109_O5-1]
MNHPDLGRQREAANANTPPGGRLPSLDRAAADPRDSLPNKGDSHYKVM